MMAQGDPFLLQQRNLLLLNLQSYSTWFLIKVSKLSFCKKYHSNTKKLATLK